MAAEVPDVRGLRCRRAELLVYCSLGAKEFSQANGPAEQRRPNPALSRRWTRVTGPTHALCS